mgnify:FL=1
MDKYKIASFDLATEDVYEIIRRQLPSNFELVTLETGTLEDRIEKARDADFIIAATGSIPTEAIKAAKKLKMIQQQGVGFDKTDVELATKLGIEVCITPEGTSVGVAEHVILLILAVYKKIIKISNDMHEGKFPMWDYRTGCYEIYGKTIGLVGFGRISREVAKRLRGFEPQIIFYDNYISLSKAEQEELNVTQVSCLDKLLELSDIVSIHVPSNSETRGMINEDFFGKMKKTAILINTARGDLINEKDFFDAINNKIIAGAGIDVYPIEPLPPNNPYVKLKNVTLTPHISAGTVDALKTKIDHVCANINRFLNGEETLHSLNRDKIRDEPKLSFANAEG